ncbi:DUF2059 domain-containing protein [Fulvimarina sp. MAC8]|uniref:DUF2059 domain-containing protein n=1 Tax=Fulvimarina sp. MAC8 TaxID=3162874 RepID=UPI0032EE0DEA
MRIKNIVPALSAIVFSGAVIAAAPALAQDTAAPETSGQAQESEPAQEVSESHLAAARAAVDAIGATDEFDNILLNAANQTKAEFIPNNPDLQSEISNMVDEKALELAPRRAALETEVARVYAQLFSEAELKQISEFYATDAGQKLIEVGPKAARDSMGAANVWTNGILRDLRQASLQGMNDIYASKAGASNAGENAAGSEGQNAEGGGDGQ